MPEPMLPPPAVRRQILEAHRDEYRTRGFEAMVRRVVLDVQETTDLAEREAVQQQMRELQAQERNAYAAAGRLQEMINALPSPPEATRGE